MATRSTIALEKKDGEIHQIYCHYDGYPQNNGQILKYDYPTIEEVEKLINGGSLSSLGRESYDEPYSVIKDYKDYIKMMKEDYNYLFRTDGRWYCQIGNSQLFLLDDILKKEKCQILWRYFLDCEFDGYGGPLLSIALYNPSGEHFYVEIDQEAKDPWVIENVLPLLKEKKVSRDTAAQMLSEYLKTYYDLHTITIYADWPDDIRHFCELLITGPGEMIKVSNITFKLDLSISSSKSKVPHHALHDAEAIFFDTRKRIRRK